MRARRAKYLSSEKEGREIGSIYAGASDEGDTYTDGYILYPTSATLRVPLRPLERRNWRIVRKTSRS